MDSSLPKATRPKALALLLMLPWLSSCTWRPAASIPQVFAVSGSPEEMASYRQLLADFTLAHPEAQWKLQEIPQDSTQALEACKSFFTEKGPAVRVVSIGSDGIPTLSSAGMLERLDSYFPPTSLASFGRLPDELDRFNGTLYAIPWSVEVNLLFGNKKLLDPLGLKNPPENFDDMLRFARLVKRASWTKGENVEGMLWPGDAAMRPLDSFIEAYVRAGGDLATVEHEGRWNSRPAYDALDELQSIFLSGLVPKSTLAGFSRQEARILFQQGGAALMRNNSRVAPLMEGPTSRLKGAFWAVPLPGPGSHAGPAVLGGRQLALGAGSGARGADLIRFLSSNETQMRMAQNFGWSPSRLSLYQDLGGSTDPRLAHLGAVRQALRNAVVRPHSPRGQADAAQCRDLLRRALSGDLTIRQAADLLSKP